MSRPKKYKFTLQHRRFIHIQNQCGEKANYFVKRISLHVFVDCMNGTKLRPLSGIVMSITEDMLCEIPVKPSIWSE